MLRRAMSWCQRTRLCRRREKQAQNLVREEPRQFSPSRQTPTPPAARCKRPLPSRAVGTGLCSCLQRHSSLHEDGRCRQANRSRFTDVCDPRFAAAPRHIHDHRMPHSLGTILGLEVPHNYALNRTLPRDAKSTFNVVLCDRTHPQPRRRTYGRSKKDEPKEL